MILLLCSMVFARPPAPRDPTTEGDPGRWVIKGKEGEDPAALAAALRWLLPGHALGPYFADPPDPRPGLADLALYIRVEGALSPAEVQRLQKNVRVESLWRAPLPTPPPTDLPPTTEDFRPLQGWLDPLPGFGFTEAAHWPGADGRGVVVADVEYGVTDHEDLDALVGVQSWGSPYRPYAWHGTSVLGMIFAGVNSYGVDGATTAAVPALYYPTDAQENYDVAAAILAAAAELLPGDVLLIEQQGYVNGSYCPVSADPAVFDAISYAVAAGIVVVEPSGNGSADLDARSWNGWFDRRIQDSGSMLVGGGAGPDTGLPLRSWMLSGGSSYGQRVDMQGWYTGIVTTANGDMGGSLADLALVGDDDAQGYTQSFGGTSGASPMVASVAAAMQGLALSSGQPVWEPRELRAILVNSGTPQNGEPWIGPQPDLRRLLRTWGR